MQAGKKNSAAPRIFNLLKYNNAYIYECLNLLFKQIHILRKKIDIKISKNWKQNFLWFLNSNNTEILSSHSHYNIDQTTAWIRFALRKCSHFFRSNSAVCIRAPVHIQLAFHLYGMFIYMSRASPVSRADSCHEYLF